MSKSSGSSDSSSGLGPGYRAPGAPRSLEESDPQHLHDDQAGSVKQGDRIDSSSVRIDPSQHRGYGEPPQEPPQPAD